MTEKFALLGIPVIVDRSEDEQTDLAKYEWIKVYGVLFGCEDQMNTLFDQAVKDAGVMQLPRQEFRQKNKGKEHEEKNI